MGGARVSRRPDEVASAQPPSAAREAEHPVVGLQRLAGNRATVQALQRWPLDRVKKLFGGRQDSPSLVITGGRVADGGGAHAPVTDPYAKVSKSEGMTPLMWWLNDRQWRAAFMKWVKDRGVAIRISEPFMEVAVPMIGFSDATAQPTLLRFLDDVVAPRMADPVVADLIVGASGEGSFESLRDAVAATDSKGLAQGRKLFMLKRDRVFQRLNEPFKAWVEWLKAAPEHRATVPALPPKATPAPVNGGGRPIAGHQRQGTRPVRPLPARPKDATAGVPLPGLEGKWKPAETPDRRRDLDHRQADAIKYAERQAGTSMADHRAKALHKLREAGVPNEELEDALLAVTRLIQAAPVTINFGQDAKQMMDDLLLYEQLGKRTPSWDQPLPTEDDKRSRHEQYMNHRLKVEKDFWGFADDPRTSGRSKDRPIYAALNVGAAVTGAAPSWGGSYFVLKPAVKERATVSHGDTFNVNPDTRTSVVATFKQLEAVVGDMPATKLRVLWEVATERRPARPMDANQYLEIQIFGGVDFRRDVERIVIDRKVVPAGSRLEEHVRRLAATYGMAVFAYDQSAWSAAAQMDTKAANAAHRPKPLRPPRR